MRDIGGFFGGFKRGHSLNGGILFCDFTCESDIVIEPIYIHSTLNSACTLKYFYIYVYAFIVYTYVSEW